MSDLHKKRIETIDGVLAKLPALFDAEGIVHATLNDIAVEVVELMHDGYSHFPLLNAIIEVKFDGKKKVSGLTRNNRAKVISFFRTMLPASYDEQKEQFGRNIKGLKKVTRITEVRQEFLDSGMDFWDWCELTGKDEDKPATDWGKRLETALKSAMDVDKGGMADNEIALIIKNSGLGAGAILALFQNDMDKQDAA